jgi:site-specific DNA-methyltransferase (adenine-specific)
MSERGQIIEGECVATMAAMEAASVDAVVTDPPYDLTSEVATRRSAFPGRYAGTEGASRGFMGKTWDGTGVAFDPATWKAALRVTKPGGYLLAFGGPRTFHRMAVAIEDGGWIIRDTIAHFAPAADFAALWASLTDDQRQLLDRVLAGGDGPLAWAFGSGFPKSRALLKPSYEPIILARKPGPLRELGIDACRVGTNEQLIAGGSKGRFFAGERVGPAAGIFDDAPNTFQQHREGRWPSNVVLSHCEPNADGEGGCRLVGTRRVRGSGKDDSRTLRANGSFEFGLHQRSPGRDYADPDGFETVDAWDCVSECPVRLLDEQAGERRNGGQNYVGPTGSSIFGNTEITNPTRYAGDTGGPSRFFPTFSGDADAGEATRFRYEPKSSRREREAGLEGLALYGVADADPEFLATMNDGIGAREHNPDQPTAWARNHHPTVKPLALCEWLVRLVTPPGGLVLDCFAGSGSVGCAAVRQGFRFVGIERESEYVEIAKRRLIYWSGQDGPLWRVVPDQPEEPPRPPRSPSSLPARGMTDTASQGSLGHEFDSIGKGRGDERSAD